MNERIINLKDGTSLYIADTLEYMGKRYVYGLQYDKYLAKELGIEAVQLPSTSPANAAYSVERLLEYWQNIRKI